MTKSQNQNQIQRSPDSLEQQNPTRAATNRGEALMDYVNPLLVPVQSANISSFPTGQLLHSTRYH